MAHVLPLVLGVALAHVLAWPALRGWARGALRVSQLLALAVLAWLAAHGTYYGAAAALRHGLPAHELLRASRGVGLACGVAATALVLGNLLSVALRRRWAGRAWASWHAVVGLFAAGLALVHGGLAAPDATGGLALGALVVGVCTGGLLLGREAGRAGDGSRPRAGPTGWRLVHRLAVCALVAALVVHVVVALRYGTSPP